MEELVENLNDYEGLEKRHGNVGHFFWTFWNFPHKLPLVPEKTILSEIYFSLSDMSDMTSLDANGH